MASIGGETLIPWSFNSVDELHPNLYRGRRHCIVGGEKSFLTHFSPAPTTDCSTFTDMPHTCPPPNLCTTSSVGQKCSFPISLPNSFTFPTTWLSSFSESSLLPRFPWGDFCFHLSLQGANSLRAETSCPFFPIPTILLLKSYTEGPSPEPEEAATQQVVLRVCWRRGATFFALKHVGKYCPEELCLPRRAAFSNVFLIPVDKGTLCLPALGRLSREHSSPQPLWEFLGAGSNLQEQSLAAQPRCRHFSTSSLEFPAKLGLPWLYVTGRRKALFKLAWPKYREESEN